MLDDKYEKTQLPNGLRIVTHTMKERQSIALGFWIAVGGRYEEDKIKGAAHFLEHIVFKGSKKYTCDEIKEGVEGVGGSLNAFTSEEQTCYYAKIPSQHIEQTFDVLSDFVFSPNIHPDDVAKEKTVIIEEIKMYHDLPQYFVVDLLEELMWPNHPLGKGLAGDVKTVTSIGSEELKSFFNKHYNPSNIVISASGDLTHQQIVDLAKNKLGHIEKGRVLDFLPGQLEQNEPRCHLHYKDTEQMHLALGMYGFSENHPDRYILSLLNVILGGNMSSRLFVEVRENRGLAYSICSQVKFMHDTGMVMIRAGVDNQKIEETVRVILCQLQKIAGECVNKNEFTRGKDYLIGQLQLCLEDTLDHMLWIGEDMIALNQTKNLKHVIHELQGIHKDELQRVAKNVFEPAKWNLSVVGPLSDEQQKNLQEILRSPQPQGV